MGSRSRGSPPLFGARPCVLTASRRTVIMPADLPTLQRSPMPRQRLSSTGVTEYWIGSAASVGLDVGGPDHLAPFLGFVGDQPPKVDGREREHVATQVGKPRLDLGVGEAGIDFLVKPVDDFGGRVFRRADAVPTGRLETRHELSHGRHLGQHVRPCRVRHRQRAQRLALRAPVRPWWKRLTAGKSRLATARPKIYEENGTLGIVIGKTLFCSTRTQDGRTAYQIGTYPAPDAAERR